MFKRRRLHTTPSMDSIDDTEPSNNTEPEVVRINPSNEATFRALKSLKTKQVQCDHHIKLLEDHIMKGTTPRGLTSQIQPNVPCADTDLLIQWERNRLDYHSKNLVNLIDYWNRQIIN